MLNLWMHCHRLDEMGALRRTFLTQYHQTWRLFTSPCLHAGAIHLIINLCCVIFIGIHLEQEFGPCTYFLLFCLSFAWLNKNAARSWKVFYSYVLTSLFSEIILGSKDWTGIYSLGFRCYLGGNSFCPRQASCQFIRSSMWIAWGYALYAYSELESLHQ